ncbi:MAG TPA: glycerophosphodiester phosphodiesterase [Bryobacteraceae bacterium]|nr:glycerophosphodiester phosphodiesterase [Bryobacteraceae bacterium]
MGIQVHGHRGARAVLPENTIPAFEYAIEQGVDAIEMDVAVTKDDVLVISHDPILNPAICRSPGGSRVIRELTFDELRRWDCGSLVNPRYPRQTPVPGARIPSLDEVLTLAVRGQFLFNIELKISVNQPQYTPTPERFAELVFQAIDRHGLRSRVIVQSFDFRPLRALRAAGVRLAALDEDEKLGDFVTVARSAGAEIIAPEKGMVTPARVVEAHRAALQVIPWTANTPQDWDSLTAAGVDGIITDDPAALIAWLKQRKLR